MKKRSRLAETRRRMATMARELDVARRALAIARGWVVANKDRNGSSDIITFVDHAVPYEKKYLS